MNGVDDKLKKEAKMVAYAYKRYLVEYTGNKIFGNMFRARPPDKNGNWKMYLRVATIVRALGTDIDSWIVAQFWARKKVAPGIYPPSILITPRSIKHYWDYKFHEEKLDEFDTFKRQQIYLDSFVKLYKTTEDRILETFSGQGIFTEQFCKRKEV